MPDFTLFPFESHGLDVSRETREKFNRYAKLLLKWQKAINLVSPTTLEDMAERHFLDSVQLIRQIPEKGVKLADLGSGAGFPGLVLAMLGIADVHLIESDVRKATFLREVSRETGTKVTVHDDRIEDVTIEGLDFITARALAPVKDLCGMVAHLAGEKPVTALFLKGEKTEEELIKAKKSFNFSIEIFDSVTDPTGKILKIKDLTKK